jgi:rhodanese-related sulfurtransferase
MLQIEKNIHKIPRDKQVVIVCNYGTISEQIIKHLTKSHSYKNLLNLQGGFFEWIKTNKNKISKVR